MESYTGDMHSWVSCRNGQQREICLFLSFLPLQAQKLKSNATVDTSMCVVSFASLITAINGMSRMKHKYFLPPQLPSSCFKWSSVASQAKRGGRSPGT